MAPTLLLIKDVDLSCKNWVVHVIVAEKGIPRIGKNGKLYQRLVLQDIEASKVQAGIFSDDIDVLKNKLKLYHTYAISNPTVKPIEEKYRFVPNNYQWTLSGRTQIKDIHIDGLNSRSIDLQLIKLADLEAVTEADPKLNILFAILDISPIRKTKTTSVCDLRIIDESMKPITITMWDQSCDADAPAIRELSEPFPIALATRLKYSAYNGLGTRGSTNFILNPPLQEALELQEWCKANKDAIRALSDLQSTPSSAIRASPPNTEKLLKIADLPPSVDEDQFLAIQAHISAKNFKQMMFYIACSKCRRGSDAYDEDTIHCNWCDKEVPAIATFKVDCELSDVTGTITATAFGTEGEDIFQVTAAEIKTALSIGELPMSIKEKMQAPKLFNFNIKVSKYKPDTIQPCRFTIRSAFPVLEEELRLLKEPAAGTSGKKVQRQLFTDDASSASHQNLNEETIEMVEHKLKETE